MTSAPMMPTTASIRDPIGREASGALGLLGCGPAAKPKAGDKRYCGKRLGQSLKHWMLP